MAPPNASLQEEPRGKRAPRGDHRAAHARSLLRPVRRSSLPTPRLPRWWRRQGRFVVRRLLVALVLIGLAFTLGGSATGRPPIGKGQLQMYSVVVDEATARRLQRDGYDVTARRAARGGVEIDLVLTDNDRRGLEARGVRPQLKRNRDGKTVTQLAAEQAAAGYTVWRSFDQPGGIRDELYRIAQRNPQTVKLEVVGHSIQGREIIALKVTRDANRIADGARPGVLYSALQHAREWISVEVSRRLLHHFVDNYGKNAEVTNLVNTRELWFLIVANPDGYQYTFDVERLWRKNVRDNDGDGLITNNDGVDPNRNFAEHWNYDDEGSTSQFASETYRGTSAASELETQAMQGLLARVHPEFQVNYHSYGNLLLYTFGWDVQLHSADDAIYAALSGTDAEPAIPGFNPGVGAELYITNGETTDYAHAVQGTLAWTPELGEGVPGSGFVFPDDEALIQHEFEINLPFALDVAKSAPDPADPVSHLGNTTKPMYVDAFPLSYGD